MKLFVTDDHNSDSDVAQKTDNNNHDIDKDDYYLPMQFLQVTEFGLSDVVVCQVFLTEVKFFQKFTVSF